MHLVTRVHFRSRDKDGSYTIRSAVPENPTLHANITAVVDSEKTARVEYFEHVDCSLRSCDCDTAQSIDRKSHCEGGGRRTVIATTIEAHSKLVQRFGVDHMTRDTEMA